MQSQFERARRVDRAAWRDLFLAAPPRVSAELGLRAECFDDALVLEAPGIDHLLFNRVVDVRLPQQAEVVRDNVRRFEGQGIRRFFVQPVENAWSRERVGQELGLEPYPRRWIELARGGGAVPEPATPFRLREARREEAQACAAILASAFDMPAAAEPVLRALVGRPRWRVEVALEAETPVAAGVSFVDGSAATLLFAATDPAFRRRGAQGALMARRVAHALDRGCRLIATETGEKVDGEVNHSERNMRRCGFRVVGIRENYAPGGTRWRSS